MKISSAFYFNRAGFAVKSGSGTATFLVRTIAVFAAFVAFDAFAALRITEICPRPDDPDPNGKEAGWIELTNMGDEPVNLNNYALIRWNRGKEDKKKNRRRLCDRVLAPGERTLVYTSEAYPNYRDGEKVTVYENDVMVFPSKVNPKKFPNVALYRVNADGEAKDKIETFIVPVDLPDNRSFGPGQVDETHDVPLTDDNTPYQYKIGDGDFSSTSGTLTVSTKKPPSDLTDGLVEMKSVEVDGSVKNASLAQSLDSAGILQNGAYDFSGVSGANSGVKTVPDMYPSGDYTVSLYFRSEPSSVKAEHNTANNGMPLFECRPSKTGDKTGMMVFLNDDNQITLQPRSGSDSKTCTSDTTVDYADGKWHHLVLVAGQTEGDELSLYIDGAAEFAGTMPFDCKLQDTVPYCFGHAYDSTSWHAFKGQLADIRVYNRALGRTEIAYLANENSAMREVTSEYGGLTCKTNAQTAVKLTYDKEKDTYLFPDGDYNSRQAYIENENQTRDDLCQSGETLSFWIKPSSFDASGKEAVALMDSRDGSQAKEGYLLLIGTRDDSKKGRVYLQRGSGGVEGGLHNIEFGETPEIPTGEYTHVVFSIDAVTKKGTLYLNARKTGTADVPYYEPSTTTRRFGGTHDSYWRGFRGEMSEIKIFSGVLPEREVVKIYNASEHSAEDILENGIEGAIGVDELRPLTIKGNLKLPEHVDGATLTFNVDKIGGDITLKSGGADLPVGEPVELDGNVTEFPFTFTLSPDLNIDVMRFSFNAVRGAPVRGVSRKIFTTLTPGAENDYSGCVAYGPNIGPSNSEIYEDFGYYLPEAMATVGEPYTVVLDVHPISGDSENEIAKVELMYRSNLGEVKYVDAPLTQNSFKRIVEEEDESGEEVEVEKLSGGYVGVIPASDIPESGKLIQFGARITDGAGRSWISPSRNNPDDCPNWYGTIVTPSDGQMSKHEKLQTFHLFVEDSHLSLMDKDYDAVKGTYPLGARCGVYDSQTDTYYDNVRIDLRGNTTAGFAKKSHGLRFSKCQPLTCKNMLEGKKGTKLKEIRKTSFIAEFADPTFIRQALSFYVWRNAGNKVPFDYPVRLNLNGEFYQLAFHSNRFTDELIEDYYGFDPMGYGYKNVGTISPNIGTTAGDVEKKTPDDGDETSSEAYGPLREFAESFRTSVNCPEDDAEMTGVVYDTFDIPAWINYLATARITQEADDIWANICLYWDKNGNGVWMPLAYDHNLSWGAWYFGDDRDKGRIGVRPDDDSFKSHPFYGGWKIRTYKQNGSTVGNGNYAVEAIWQNSDFRRMYLRRLRTLMDELLKAPGTAKEDTPFWNDYVKLFKEVIAADAEIDREKWGESYKDTVIYVWDRVLGLDEAYDDLWENYIVRRRNHLYNTHSITNTAREIGYASDRNAGIPLSHPEKFAPILIGKIDGGVKLTNPNVDSIDLSGWTVEGLMDVSTLPEDSADVVTLPPGTVLLGGSSLVLAYDRKTFIGKNEPCFVIGLAVYGDDKTWIPAANPDATAIVLKKANGDVVVDDLVPEGVAAWLNEALEKGVVTVDSLSAVTKAADYEVAYLLNEVPVSDMNENTVLKITSFSVDVSGNVMIGASLDVNGESKRGSINGYVRLYSSQSPSGPWDETDVSGQSFDGNGIVELTGGSGTRNPVNADSPCFFKVKITR